MSIRHLIFSQVQAFAAKYGVFISREPLTRKQHLKQLLRSSEVNCVLDVGAFVGEYALELRELGFQGKVVSFEPFPNSFATLSAKMQNDTGWTGQPYGLSDQSRPAELLVNDRGDFNSMLNLRAFTKDVYQLNPATNTAQISLRRLDEVLPPLLQNLETPRIFLKIDTQGHDLEVMRGAAGVKPWIAGIQTEVPAVPLYDDMHTMAEMMEAYRAEGFIPVGFYPVNTLRHTQISPEFDVFFKPFDDDLANAS